MFDQLHIKRFPGNQKAHTKKSISVTTVLDLMRPETFFLFGLGPQLEKLRVHSVSVSRYHS